jgi:integrase
MERMADEVRRVDTDLRFFQRITEDAMRKLGYTYTPGIRTFLEAWLKNTKASVSESTFSKYDLTFRLFLEFAHQSVKLTDVNTEMICRFRDRLLESGRSPGTVNFLVRGCLSIPFKAASQAGEIPRNPFARVKPVRSEKVTKGVFSPDEVEKLLQTAQGEFRGVILVGLLTGMRLGDASRLKWENVDLETPFPMIAFQQTKTRKKVAMPLHARLAEWLREAHPGEAAAGPIFPSLCGKPTSRLSLEFAEIMANAGIDAGVLREGNDGKGRSVSLKSFHSCRLTFISNSANAQVPAEVRQALSGHSSLDVHKKYSHFSADTLRSAIAKLG